MTTGALIFAYNNESIDYVRMAAWSASNIRRHLGIPVALVTDQPTDYDFDQVIIYESSASDYRSFVDNDVKVPWNNRSRPHALDLTPWDRTLLLDADYVVASDRLRLLIEASDGNIMCHKEASDATGGNNFQLLNQLGRYAWPLCWATVVVFDRDDHAQRVFDSMKMIRDNWKHYQDIYHIRSRTYRNDHALTIALGMANGHGPYDTAIPWSLTTVLPEHKLKQLDNDRYRVEYQQPDGRSAWLELVDQDFHAMGKQSLMHMIS